MPTDGSSHGSTCYDCRSGNWPHKFGTVRPVLGDVPMEQLGRDYHEHLFKASPLLVGDELDDEQASMQEAESLRRAGIDAFVDAPTGSRAQSWRRRPYQSVGIAVVHVSDQQPGVAALERQVMRSAFRKP